MLPENVRFIIEKLNKNGFLAYAVGGCVRDRLLGIEPDDWDITTSALPEETQRVFSEFHLNLKGLKHGTVGVIRNGTMLEVTTFRVDGSYTDSRRPDSVTFTPSLKEDLARRDFTVNAMAMDLKGNIIDEFSGKEDLDKRLIRCVGDARTRFNEDALRIMRGLRFASKKGFSLEEETLSASIELADNLRNIAYERIYTELKKMLALQDAYKVMEKTLPVFKAVFPTLKGDNWQEICENVKNAHCEKELCLAIILLNADTEEELLRLKAETKFKRLILSLKELMNRKIENDRVFFQRLMCEYNKETVLFLARYLTVITGEDHNLNAQNASQGITSVSELNIKGDEVKNMGYKSYQIKNALNELLQAVIFQKCENTPQALKEYLRNGVK